jgi:hypothetical protein
MCIEVVAPELGYNLPSAGPSRQLGPVRLNLSAMSMIFLSQQIRISRLISRRNPAEQFRLFSSTCILSSGVTEKVSIGAY